MDVLKRNGEIEAFDKEKFINSLSKSGFTEEEINTAYSNIESSLYNEIPTDEIYDKALEELKKTNDIEPVVNYSLRKAVMELGPTGFPFEQLVSRIFQEKGYKTETGVMIPGKCIDHEVDVIAYNEEELILVEAKFHNDQHTKSDTKVALYVKARFDDLFDSTISIGGKDYKNHKGILITNTGFTNNSKRYVKCVGTFEMISWTYPRGQGLLKMIEEVKIHPVTSIPQLSRAEKLELIEQGCIYCKDLLEDPTCLEKAKVTGSKREEVLGTAKLICKDH